MQRKQVIKYAVLGFAILFATNLMATTITGGPQAYPEFSVTIDQVTAFTCQLQGDPCINRDPPVNSVEQVLNFLLPVLGSSDGWDTIEFSQTGVRYIQAGLTYSDQSRWAVISANSVFSSWNYPDEVTSMFTNITTASGCLFSDYNCSNVEYSGSLTSTWQDGQITASFQGTMSVSDPPGMSTPEPATAVLWLCPCCALLLRRRLRA